MNRFFDIPSIASRELLPWESRRRGLNDKTGQFELQEELLRFRSDIAGGIIWIPQLEISDLASIPDLAAAFLGINTSDQRIAGGAWVHDYIYKRQGQIVVLDESLTVSREVTLSRKQADEILCFEAMSDLGANLVQRNLAYQNLRRFGNKWKRESFWERLT